jgi:hypothetical protein
MNITGAAEMLSGVTLASFAAAAMFFFKFWRASHDRFFLALALSSGLIAVERFMTFFISDVFDPLRVAGSDGNWIYVVRLVAFLIILAAVIDKNRAR